LCDELPNDKPMSVTVTVTSKKCLVYTCNFKDFISEYKRCIDDLNNYFKGRNDFIISRAKDIKIHYYLMAKEKMDQPINDYDLNKIKLRN
jgi:hypothetical protein